MFFIRGKEDENPMNILNRGYWVTTILSALSLVLVTNVMMNTNGATGDNGIPTWIYFFGAGCVGLATSIAFVYITQYYTAGTFRPVKEIAEASKTGPATNIIAGLSVGFETTAVTAITIGIALLASNWLGAHSGLGSVGGVFGTAVATMGMLMTTAYVLAMDTFGPITDNAGGIAEFSRAEAGAREITDRLDAVGNTTKALTKGYAIASASLAAFLLFSAYIDKVNLILQRQIDAGTRTVQQGLMTSVNLEDVNVFVAALIAAMLVYFFSSLAIRAVGTTAQAIIVEVRRQFREIPGIMDYTGRPDYARVVDITTRAALREMMLPGIVAVATPIIVGVLLGYEAVAGLADGRHHRRRPARHSPQQRRRRVGQRQEVHRVGSPARCRRQCARQEDACARCRRRRRHRRRSVQGHRRPVAPRSGEVAGHHYPGHGSALHPLVGYIVLRAGDRPIAGPLTYETAAEGSRLGPAPVRSSAQLAAPHSEDASHGPFHPGAGDGPDPGSHGVPADLELRTPHPRPVAVRVEGSVHQFPGLQRHAPHGHAAGASRLLLA